MMLRYSIEFLLILVSIALHEVGHIRRMEDLGIFAGMKLHWWGPECLVNREVDVDLSYMDAMEVYLAGFGWSLIPLPIWMWVGESPAKFMFYCLIGALFDFQGCIKLTKLKLEKKKMVIE